MTERIYVALDLETTGLDADRDAIIEVGAVRFQEDRILDVFTTLVNPQRPIPRQITQITGIRSTDVSAAPTIDLVIPELLSFVGSDVTAIIAHNAAFDLGFLRAAGIDFRRPAFDTWELASILLPRQASYSLGELCQYFSIPLEDAHRAPDDAEATARLFQSLQAEARCLPKAILEEIVASAQHSEWSYTLFFHDAAVVQRQQGDVTLSGLGVEEKAGLLTEETNQSEAVPIEQLMALLAPEGPLSELLGDKFEVRPGQVKMAALVLQALNDGQHLLVEAGTGIGKSLAYLLPAALWTTANERRVVIATNTIALQDQLVEKDIPQVQALMAAAGYPTPRCALLKGRQHYLCTRRLHSWRTSHPLTDAELTVLAKVLVWLPTTTTGDVSELALNSPAERAIWTRLCSEAATCTPERCNATKGEHATHDYYLEAHRQAESAHLVVVNHALLLADLAAKGRILPPFTHLVVDETHRLEQAATEQLTFRVEWPIVQQLLQRLAGDGDLGRQVYQSASNLRHTPVLEALPALNRYAQQTSHELAEFADKLSAFAVGMAGRPEGSYVQRLALDGAVRSQPTWSQIEIEWDLASNALQTLVTALEVLVARLDAAQWWQSEPLSSIYQEVRAMWEWLAELAQQLDYIILAPRGNRNSRVAWLEVSERPTNRVSLAVAPLTVHELLEAGLIHSRRSAVFTGATLRTGSGFRFLRERLGLWDVTIATVESPFDYKRSTLLYMPSDLPLPNQHQYQQAVEQAIVEAARATVGHTLVLFTSYQQLRKTADAVADTLEREGISLLQHGQSSRLRLLRAYREADQAVLFGTRSFWEGIDLPGDELRCLMIVRLPFSVPSDPLVAARSAEFDDPFNDYTVPDAVLRFRQGFGRLIRRATDQGVVVLLDSRVWRKQYGQAFLDALPECKVRRAPLGNMGAEIGLWLQKTKRNKS